MLGKIVLFGAGVALGFTGTFFACLYREALEYVRATYQDREDGEEDEEILEGKLSSPEA